MPVEMLMMKTAYNSPARLGALRGKRVISSALVSGIILFCSCLVGQAAEQKVEILFSPSAALIARSVTQAQSSFSYELKQAKSAAALSEFCQAGNSGRPLIVISALEMPSHLEEHCGAGGVAKADLGYVTLVLVQKASDPPMSLTARQIYLGLAESIPSDEGLVRNKVKKWSEVDAALPDVPIKFLLPGAQEATREIFDAEALVSGCRQFPAIRKIFDAETRNVRCLRVQSGLVVSHSSQEERLAELKAAAPGAIALVTEGAEMEAGNAFRVVPFNGMLPTPEHIAAEDYTLTVPLFLYARAEQLSEEGLIEPVRAWFLEAVSERAIGENGYLERFGFSSVPAATREWQRRAYSE